MKVHLHAAVHTADEWMGVRAPARCVLLSKRNNAQRSTHHLQQLVLAGTAATEAAKSSALVVAVIFGVINK
jgi:hypothetical protein